MSEKIKAMVIFEMLGNPPEYLNEMLMQHVEKLGKENGIKVIGKRISEPKKVENSALHSNFIESEIELDSINELMKTAFAYMPSHIEIISPENIRISNYDLNVFGNELVRRLHQYDEIARIAQIQNARLADEIKKAAENKNVKTEKSKSKLRKKK